VAFDENKAALEKVRTVGGVGKYADIAPKCFRLQINIAQYHITNRLKRLSSEFILCMTFAIVMGSGGTSEIVNAHA
jgi:hypothetical protein